MIFMNKMGNSIIKKYYKLYFILLLIIIDFISKYSFNFYLGDNKVNLINDIIFLKIYKNTWIAFSIELPYLKLLTIIIIFLIIVYYLKYEKPKNNNLINSSFIFIIAWAIWNARERLLFWKVTDFIWIKYFSVFNFADIYINIWIILYLVIIVLKKDKH